MNTLRKLFTVFFALILVLSSLDSHVNQIKALGTSTTIVESDVPTYTTEDFEKIDPSTYRSDRINVKIKSTRVSSSSFFGSLVLDEPNNGFSSYGITNLSPIQNIASTTGKSSIQTIDTNVKWYTATLSNGTNPIDVISALSLDSRVVVAEPDYYRYIDSYNQPTEITDPGMADQWYLNTINAQAAWDYLESQGINPGGSRDVVVAVIDTGVDYNHPDLHANMWVNVDEIPGNGIDDDNNGYVDDYLGYDAITNDKDPMDDHGHGTHVAGIIGMQANNGIGGVGVAYNVQVMAIKAGQSSGIFSSSDIAKAIYYAVDNGADVINMSFGGYSESLLEKEALQVAYGTSVLVAAAGNDSLCNEVIKGCPIESRPIYPGSYNWVIGVMASDKSGDLATFSNYDAIYQNSKEYEVMAPGYAIYSTLPNGKYAKWSGTSMATPIVSAVAALVRSNHPNKANYTSRLIMGQLVSTGPRNHGRMDKNTGQMVLYNSLDSIQALKTIPTPNVTLVDNFVFDTIYVNENNNNNRVVDAGEIVDLAIILKNQWGQADNVIVNIDALSTGDVPDPYVEFITDTVNYGTIGSFASDDNGLFKETDVFMGVNNPFTIKISNTTPNDHLIKINVNITANNGLDVNDTYSYSTKATITIIVRNGRVLPYIIDHNMTLTNDTYWIINGPTLIEKGITVLIEPGTNIQFYSVKPKDQYSVEQMPYLQVEGSLIAIGTETNPILIFPSMYYSDFLVRITKSNTIDSYAKLQYVEVKNPQIRANIVDHCRFIQDSMAPLFRIEKNLQTGASFYYYGDPYVYTSKTSNSIFNNLGSDWGDLYMQGISEGNLFANTKQIFQSKIATNNVFLRNYKEVNFINYASIGNDWGISTNNLSFQSFFPIKNSENGSTYITFYPGIRIDSIDSISMLREAEKYAKYLGGHVATINNQSENDFVQSYVNTYLTNYSLFNSSYPMLTSIGGNILGQYNHGIGFNNFDSQDAYISTNEFSWISTESSQYSNWLNVGEDRTSRPGVATYMPNSNGWTFLSGTPYTFIIEIPDKGISITQSYLDNQRQEYLSSWSTISNNAFLNVWDKPKQNYWMTFTTWLERESTQHISSNFWGVSSEIIDMAITDYYDDFNLGKIDYEPILSNAPVVAYPFVVEVYLSTNLETRTAKVGAEPVTVNVTFNRDMDTSIQPQVSFGPSMPFTDYMVKGDWVNPRTWEGNLTISPVASDGYQYFRVAGAVAADDPWLVTGNDYERFRFEIITQGAESMNLQVSGEEGKVNLSWIQNDFELLAGYNMYRSSSADGTYTKINTSLIPSDQKSYIDTNVAPGQNYYYKFTVVQTDFNESGFSNTAMGTPFDTIVPVITHTPILGANPNLSLSFSAIATDNVSVSRVELFYRLSGTTSYLSREMTKTTGDRFVVTLEASLLKSPGLDYYIQATDGYSVSRSGSMSTPHQILITDAPKITTITPVEGVTEGGTVVNIKGSNFKVGAKVFFGGSEGTGVIVEDSNSILVTTPSHFPAMVDVTVTNTDSYSDTYLNGFTYVGDVSEVSLPTTEAYRGQVIEIPVYVDKVSSLLAASLTILYDNEFLAVKGIRKGTLTSDFSIAYNTGTLGQIYISMASAGAVSGQGSLAYIQFEVLDTEKTSSILELSQAKLNGGSILVNKVNGQFNLKTVFKVLGNIFYYSDNTPVKGVNLSLTGLKTYTNSSLSQGNFTIEGIEEGAYKLTGRKSDDVYGISALDASYALQADVGLRTLTGNSFIAGDVNKSGSVDSMDAAYILQKAVGLITGAFPGSGKVWEFVPNELNYTLINGDLSSQNMTAILLGDISGNWASAMSSSIQSISDVELLLSDTLISGSKDSSITVSINDHQEAVFAIDFVFSYNSTYSKFNGISLTDNAQNAMLAYKEVRPGEVHVSIASSSALKDIGSIVKINFTGKGQNDSNIVIQSININEQRAFMASSVHVSGITLDQDSLIFKTIGSSQILNATIAPLDAAIKELKWTSSNTNVVTVDQSGKVTSVGNGKATISVETVDGNYSDTVEITVDSIAPIITGLDQSAYIETTPSVSYNEGTAYLDGTLFVSGTKITIYGEHTLVVTDEVGNVTSKSFTIIKTILAPTNLVISGSSYNQLSLKWTTVLNASSYQIYRSSSKTGVYALVGMSSTNKYTQSNLSLNKVYYYKVKANIVINGTSFTSPMSLPLKGQPILNKVTILSVKSNVSTSNIIKWSPILGASGYEIYYSTGNSNKFILLKRILTTEWTNASIKTNITYNYKIRAYRIVGSNRVYGAFSNVTSIRPTKLILLSLFTNHKTVYLEEQYTTRISY